jgi:hypothetical protein
MLVHQRVALFTDNDIGGDYTWLTIDIRSCQLSAGQHRSALFHDFISPNPYCFGCL